MLGKAKIKSKCKGDDTSNVLILDTKKIRRVLANSIPVLSIFALVGILAFSVNMQNHSLTCSAAGDVCPDGLPQPTTPCEQEGYIWQQQTNHCWECVPDPNYVVPPSASLTIDDNTIKDNITAVRNDIAYASHNIKLNASDIASYTLTITGPTNLTTTDSNGNTVSSGTTITGAGNKTPAYMGNNTWGYGWGSTSADEASLSYQSFTGSAQTLASGNADSNHNASLENKLVFAAKFSDNATEGHYKATVGLNLTVTPRALNALEQISLMQQMTPAICDAAQVGDTAILIDSRDGSEYTIRKHSDSNCWMTQNLRIVNKTVSSTDSDMTSGSFTIPASSTSGFSSYNTANAYYSGNTNYGTYYTWYAATAGTGTQSVSSGDVSNSICPKGWKLPKGGTGTTNDFAKAVGYTTSISGNPNIWTSLSPNPTFASNAMTVNGITWPAAGYYRNSSPYNVGSNGVYWSRTANNGNSAYYLGFYSGNLYPAGYDYKYIGFSVRCVAEKPQEYTYSISYKFKDGHSLHSGTMPSDETITTTDTSHTFTVKSGPMVQVGTSWCGLKNWLGSDGVVYTPNSTVTLTPDQPSIILTTNATGTCAGA